MRRAPSVQGGSTVDGRLGERSEPSGSDPVGALRLRAGGHHLHGRARDRLASTRARHGLALRIPSARARFRTAACAALARIVLPARTMAACAAGLESKLGSLGGFGMQYYEGAKSDLNGVLWLMRTPPHGAAPFGRCERSMSEVAPADASGA